MGDACDHSDIERFMRSTQGSAHLARLARTLEGRRIEAVTFKNVTQHIETELHMDDGSSFTAFSLEHEIDRLRETFGEAIEEEYFRDFPERRKGVQ